jgi:hypothetical protein
MEEIPIETCVLCGNETPYTKEVSILMRQYFIEGAGQLCKECFKKVYKVNGSIYYFRDR